MPAWRVPPYLRKLTFERYVLRHHEEMHVVEGEEVLEGWPVDLRGW